MCSSSETFQEFLRAEKEYHIADSLYALVAPMTTTSSASASNSDSSSSSALASSSDSSSSSASTSAITSASLTTTSTPSTPSTEEQDLCVGMNHLLRDMTLDRLEHKCRTTFIKFVNETKDINWQEVVDLLYFNREPNQGFTLLLAQPFVSDPLQKIVCRTEQTSLASSGQSGQSVQSCQSCQFQFCMILGNNKTVAETIADQVGYDLSDPAQVALNISRLSETGFLYLSK